MNRFLTWLREPETTADISGLDILDHARVYLEQYGDGRNQEYTRARQILIQARVRILTGSN